MEPKRPETDMVRDALTIISKLSPLVDQEVDLALAWTTVCRAARHDRQSTWLWHPQCRFNQHELGAVTG